MLGKCELAPDINNCPHYIKDVQSCEIGNEVCCFFENPGKGKDINYRENRNGMKSTTNGRITYGSIWYWYKRNKN